ncbi:MAG: succinate dehydrogenase cytochrome b subunit [Bacteroidetes bacterium]|nr:succinate dehydrogenase cytochrome b subunit [Bacteroidota bacterium]
MSSAKQFFSSSIGKKVLMSLTGIFLCTFLVVHLIGNLQLFNNDGGVAFNKYSVFMTTFPPIKIISYLLYTSILLHAIFGLVITMANRKARPVKYAVNRPQDNSAWASRNMGILGTVLFVFIVVHMGDFWYEYKFGKIPTVMIEGVEYKDLYAEVAEAFSQKWYALLYVVCMVAISFHLAHGFQSAFQTLGLNHKKYMPLIKNIGIWVFAIIIPALFAAMPIYFAFIK